MTNISVGLSSEKVKEHYVYLADNVDKWRKELGRPLTLSEKILFSHLEDKKDLKRTERMIQKVVKDFLSTKMT